MVRYALPALLALGVAFGVASGAPQEPDDYNVTIASHGQSHTYEFSSEVTCKQNPIPNTTLGPFNAPNRYVKFSGYTYMVRKQVRQLIIYVYQLDPYRGRWLLVKRFRVKINSDGSSTSYEQTFTPFELNLADGSEVQIRTKCKGKGFLSGDTASISHTIRALMSTSDPGGNDSR